jgi:preprotein translocase subunit SecA
MTDNKDLAAQADAILEQHGHGGHVHGPNCNHGHDHGHHHQAAGETFVRTSPKVGRNDPCPCGSGKKHKKCCLG